MSAPVLELRAISKRYDGIPVLKGVSLTVNAGEIHALVGENGAGKSTLMNIIFGMPVIRESGGYEGEIRLGGRVLRAESPHEAMKAGIGMVHQEFMLIPAFSVAENIKLNREPTRAGLLSRIAGRGLETMDREKMGRDARASLDRAGIGLDEWAPVAGLPVGHMQFIEIAREIDKTDSRLIIFDEPTAVLTESGAHEMLGAMQALARDGLGILFITHRLEEVRRVASRITVLRDGEVVANLEPPRTSVAAIAELMVGRPAALPRLRPKRSEASSSPHAGAERSRPGRAVEPAHIEFSDGPAGTSPHSGAEAACSLSPTGAASPSALAVDHLRVEMPGERIEGLSFDLAPGEVLGIAGLAGHGKIGVANGIMGIMPATGAVHVDGRHLPLGRPRAAILEGLAFVSEDRRGTGLLLDESIELNMALAAIEVQGRFLRRFPISGLRLIDRRAVRDHAAEMIRRLDIRCTGPGQLVRRLSGGNQQKVCLARAMTLRPRVLLVSEPTRGIDVGAKERVLGILADLNAQGVSLVVTSSELAELRAICDRILIVHGGRLQAMLAPDASDREFGLAMSGEMAAAS